MINIKDFNIQRLINVLNNDINSSWVNILATHIYHNDNDHYILYSKEFSQAHILEDDILHGIPYCEIGTLYEYSLSYFDNSSKTNSGQFYTPNDIAVLMGSFIQDFNTTKIWLDPCVGSGNLLYGLLKNVNNPEKFLRNNIIASDIDNTALLIARTLLVLEFEKENTNLFNDIENNFIKYNYLSEGNNDTVLPHYDYVIVNPPYVSRMRNSLFDTDKCGDLYSYFIEKIIKNSDGFIAITPQSFTHAKKFKLLRKILLNKNKNKSYYYNFDNVPGNIFRGIKFGSQNTNKANSIRPTIIINNDNYKTNKITSLLKWKTSQRKELLENIDNDLSTITLNDNIFPKVGKCYQDFYNSIKNNNNLESIISSSPTDYVLYVPSTPRYYISASKRNLNRSSIKRIYFDNEENLNIAYVLLNSAYFYWWWRVVDGGMTISTTTIKTLPLLKIDNIKTMVALLEDSENKNIVSSKNAGKIQENIKHPDNIVEKITCSLTSNNNALLLMQSRLNSSIELIKK